MTGSTTDGAIHRGNEREPRALVVTVSNRAAAGVYEDRGGPVLVEGLARMGFAVDGPQVVRDGDPVEQALRAAVAAGYDVVLTTGGTGLTPLDLTPEMTRRVIDREVPGIAEAIRLRSIDAVPTAVLSRGVAGLAGTTLVVNLPGSPGGCRDGIAVLEPVLRHAVDQVHGGDHPAGGGT
ncbi:MAG: MogA/MoaB family molybdenum cofactor biosynthesis protein [Motilibacteraceae bacterium]